MISCCIAEWHSADRPEFPKVNLPVMDCGFRKLNPEFRTQFHCKFFRMGYKRSSEGAEERATWETMKSAGEKKDLSPRNDLQPRRFYCFLLMQVLDFTLNPA